jgi:5-dehydro-2-deoxygluconokinase
MALGYDGRLYLLAFDHRASFAKFCGITGEPSEDELTIIRDGKALVFEGMLVAAEKGQDPETLGVLVDELYGGEVPRRAKQSRLKLAMPVEKSGQEIFDFEYGEQFGDHILDFDPDFSKVLVRYNPDGDAEANELQRQRLKRLADWLHDNDRKFLFELLVPPESAQLDSVGGDMDRYDAELRPDLMRRIIAEFQDYGCEVDVWKIEGLDTRADCEMIAQQAKAGGRDGVACVLLGRGADDAKVDHWLKQAAPVDGFVGFAIGRSIWAEPLKSYIVDRSIDRDKAAATIADNYLRFIDVWQQSE